MEAILRVRDCVARSSKPANNNGDAINLVTPGIPTPLSGGSDEHSRIPATTVFAPIITGLGGSYSKGLNTGTPTCTHMRTEYPVHILLTAIEPNTSRGISVPINSFSQGESTETHQVFHSSGILSQTESQRAPSSARLRSGSNYPKSAAYVAPCFLEPKVDIEPHKIDLRRFLETSRISKR
jgi:hypothetical protein